MSVAEGNETAYDVSGSRAGDAACSVQCSATVPREHLCSNTKTTQVFDPMVTFWSYLMVRVLNGLTLGKTHGLLHKCSLLFFFGRLYEDF